MSNDIDDPLSALFAEAHETLPSAEFLQSVLARMQRARRLQGMRRVALAVALAILVAWLMPWVLATTAAAVHAVVNILGVPQSYGALIISPAGWGVSMLIAFFVLLRTGALRRR